MQICFFAAEDVCVYANMRNIGSLIDQALEINTSFQHSMIFVVMVTTIMTYLTLKQDFGS